MSADSSDDIAVTEHVAPGVSYLRIDGAPGRFFRCNAHRATLSVSSCAERWRKAQQSAVAHGQDRFEKCRSCPIGARHNGVDPVYRSPIFGLPICPRARAWAPRMIFNRLGISKSNRQGEFLKQRNGKGTVPGFRLDPRRIAVITEAGERIELRDDLTADTVEIAVQTLRVVVGRVVFTRPRMDAATISTLELAERFRPAEHADRPRRQREARASASAVARMVERRAAVLAKARQASAPAMAAAE